MSAGRRGMTFVELLLAATIFAVLSVGLTSHLRAGAAAWRTATERVEGMQRMRVALDRLERDLRNAALLDPQDAFELPSEFSSEALGWYVVSPPARADAPPSLTYVRYEWDASGRQLLRWAQTVQEARAGLEAEPQAAAREVEHFALRYAVQEPGADGVPQLTWQPQWADAASLPALVEVTLELSGGRRVQRIVHVPVGRLQPEPEGG